METDDKPWMDMRLRAVVTLVALVVVPLVAMFGLRWKPFLEERPASLASSEGHAPRDSVALGVAASTASFPTPGGPAEAMPGGSAAAGHTPGGPSLLPAQTNPAQPNPAQPADPRQAPPPFTPASAPATGMAPGSDRAMLLTPDRAMLVGGIEPLGAGGAGLPVAGFAEPAHLAREFMAETGPLHAAMPQQPNFAGPLDAQPASGVYAPGGLPPASGLQTASHTAPVASDSPGMGYAPASAPAGGPPAAPPQGASLEAMQQELRTLGATHYLLETWGDQPALYRFGCDVARVSQGPAARHFEATATTAPGAMAEVIRQIVAWHQAGMP